MQDYTVRTENGKKVFIDSEGKEICTYDETIEWMLKYKLEPLHDFLEILTDDDDVHREASIAKTLLEKAEKEILDTIKFIKKNHGEVEVIRACHHQSVEPEMILDVNFIPAEQKSY